MDRIGVILFDAAFASAFFLTLIVLAMMGCRQPVRRILLARVAILASLAIIPLVAWGRLPRLDLIDTFVESRFFPKALFLAAAAVDRPEATGAAADSDPGPGRYISWWMLDRAEQARRWLPRGLTLLDLACVAAGGGWLLLGIGGAHWLIFRSRPPSPSTRALFESLLAGCPPSAARSGLRVCARLRHPVVTGLLRPTILIPEALDQPGRDPEPLRLSLLHELAHAERSDHRFSAIAGIAQSLWFFLPHVWWIRSQLLIDQEFLADRLAAERYGTSSAYASSLLSLVTPDDDDKPAAPRPGRLGSARGVSKVGVPSALFQRIMMLLNCPYPVEARTPRVWSWTSRFAVILASVAAACLVVRWPQASMAVPAPVGGGPQRIRFQAPHFVAEPMLDVDGRPRSRVYVLPVTLPSRFVLDVDVSCRVLGPVEIRVIGEPIIIDGTLTARAPGSNTHADDPGGWRHVRLVRDNHRVSIEVDGYPFPEFTHDDTPSDWLTIEPPSVAPAEFRRLIVRW